MQSCFEECIKHVVSYENTCSLYETTCSFMCAYFAHNETTCSLDQTTCILEQTTCTLCETMCIFILNYRYVHLFHHDFALILCVFTYNQVIIFSNVHTHSFAFSYVHKYIDAK